MSNTSKQHIAPRTSLRGSYSAERCHLCCTVGISTSKAGIFQISRVTVHTASHHVHDARAERRPRPPPRGRAAFRLSAGRIPNFRFARGIDVNSNTRHTVYPSCRGTPRGQNAPEHLGRSAAVRRVASWLVAPRLDRLETPGAPALGPAFDRIANRHASPGAILHATRASGHPACNASPGPSCIQREP